MDPLRAYVVPLKSLRNGMHTFGWLIDRSFFDHFENSPIREGQFQVRVDLDKEEGLSTLHLSISGSYRSICDRCLASIVIPVQGQYTLYVKTAENDESDPNLICMGPGEVDLKLADVLYDYVCLTIPISQLIQCEEMDPSPCDQDVLNRIQIMERPQDPSIWEGLKNFEQT